MSNITKHDAAKTPSILGSDDLTAVLESSLYPGASPASIQMVLGYCKAAGLDPMQKPVHIVPMWDTKAGRSRDVVMPGIGLYRTQAARSGCAGISEPDFGPDVSATIGGQSITYPEWCRVTVKRRLATGEIVDFTAKEIWLENYAVKGGKEKSVAPNAMWTKRPYGQIAKCAEAQALRKAFPEIGSAPTADEMAGKTFGEDDVDQATGEIHTPTPTLSPSPPAPQPLPLCSDERFAQNLPSWAALVHNGPQTAETLLAHLSKKGTFTDEQRRTILALRPIDKPATDAAPEVDQFLRDME